MEHNGWTVFVVGVEPQLEQDAAGRWHIFAPGWVFEHDDGRHIEFEDGALVSFDTEATAAHLEFGGIIICGHRLDEMRDLALRQ